jgi:excisionase family DNA binding protein
MADAPWVVMQRAELDALLDRAVERGRSLAAESTWMQADEVAELLGVTRETVITYCRRDGLPCRYAGKKPVFRRDEVTAWIDSRRGGPSLRAVKGGRR